MTNSFQRNIVSNQILNVCIIGNLNIDIIIRDVEKLPEWGKEVLGNDHLQVSSGQSGYLAFALSRLGIKTSVIANVGEDVYGKQILGDLKDSGIDSTGVSISSGEKTGITVAIVRPDGERAFVSNLACLNDFSVDNIQNNWNTLIKAKVVCLVGLFNLPNLNLINSAQVLGDARREHKITMLDTGWDTEGWNDRTLHDMQQLLREVTIFMPNLDEARAITQEENLENVASKLISMGPEIVVVKCGADGSYVCNKTESHFVASIPVNVFDAVGAGDVFNAGFIFGYLNKWSLENCLKFGNSASSLYISRKIDRFPQLSEVYKVAHSAYYDIS